MFVVVFLEKNHFKEPSMRYFGESSLSSWIHRILQVSWVLVMVGFVVFTGFLAVAAFPEVGGKASAAICEAGKSDPEWVEFVRLPAYVKAMVFPYLMLVAFLLLQVVSQSRNLFSNFRQNSIFTTQNVASLSRLSRYLIGFSVVTFNFSTLLVSLILLLVCEIFKNGTALQTEHDLTV